MQHLVGRWGTNANGGLRYYILDNEPSIWHSTHRDVRPTAPTMDEIRDKTIDFAQRIKAVDPTALVVGPEEWGWSGYFYSGYDQQYGSIHGWGSLPDRAEQRRRRLPALVPRPDAPAPHDVGPAPPRRLHRPLLPAGRRVQRRRVERDAAAPQPLDALAVGSELRRRDVDQRPRAAHAAAEELGQHLLPGDGDRHHRIQLGRRKPHQRRDHAGRHLRDLRPRGARHGGALDDARGEHADLQGDEDVPQLRREQVDVRRHERRSHGAQSRQRLGVRRPAVSRRRSDRHGHQQEPRRGRRRRRSRWRTSRTAAPHRSGSSPSANTITRLADLTLSGNTIVATLPAQSVTLFVVPANGTATPPQPPTNVRITRVQ